MNKKILISSGSFVYDIKYIIRQLIDNKTDIVSISRIKDFEKYKNDYISHIIITGGSDVSPALYGETENGAVSTDINTDLRDYAMIKYGFTHKIPILGICRGNQILNVVAGGTLIQHLKQTHAYYHGITSKYPLISRLGELTVNSLHHQAIEHVGKDFNIVARHAENKTIEAIYKTNSAIGVQFHPELLVEEVPEWFQLFEWFVRGNLKQNWFPAKEYQTYNPQPKAYKYSQYYYCDYDDEEYPTWHNRTEKDAKWNKTYKYVKGKWLAKDERGAWNEDKTITENGSFQFKD